MLFNSLQFAVFLPLVFICYWIIPNKYRWLLILLASYYFYMSWEFKYIVLIFFTTIVSYVSALIIARVENDVVKKFVLVICLMICFGVLFFYKYFNFTSSIISRFMQSLSIPLHPVTLKLILPVGISFYTFQTFAYVVDVYRGTIKAEHHFGKYAAFVSFFPQLVAGPIERAYNLLPQMSKPHYFQYDKVTYGLKLMAWGFWKKMVVADNLSVYVDMAYDRVRNDATNANTGGGYLLVATMMFAFQIYCDFSGYSDIAVGVARIFDVNLMKNFKSPYFSRSIKAFWSRWHISLSSWFRDYLYIPLGGNRCSKLRNSVNLMLTFLVSGLWHGANLTFVIWGGIHGIAQIIENFTRRRKRQKGYMPMIGVFLFCNITWIFFRSGSISAALTNLRCIPNGIWNPIQYLKDGFRYLGIGKGQLLLIMSMLSLLLVYDFIDMKQDVIKAVSKFPMFIRWSIYYVLVACIILMGNFGSAQFVYFQF